MPTENITCLPSRADAPRTILVVDDDERVLVYVCRMLALIGYQHVIQASSGNEARRLFQENEARIWLLITDFVMPEENGDELAEALLNQGPGLAVLFISGNDPASLHSRIPLQPGKNFLQKPFTMADLRQLIQTAMTAQLKRLSTRPPAASGSSNKSVDSPIVQFPAV